MPRRPAQITQADINRALRAAKQAGAVEVVVHLGREASIVIRLASVDGDEKALERCEEIIL